MPRTGKTPDPQADSLRAASRDVRRAHRIRTGKATTVQLDVDALRVVLEVADQATYLTLVSTLGEHTARAVYPQREIAASA